MRAVYAVIVFVGLASVLSTLCMYASPHWACLILDLVAFVALLALLILSAVIGFKRWRRLSAYWMLPAIICLAFLTIDWFMPEAGRFVADRQFKRHLTDYNEVVAEIRDTKSFQSATLDIVKTEHRGYKIRAIKAARCEDGSVVVAFLLNTPVLLLHEGYVYDTGACKQAAARPENNWPYVRPLTGNWYHFSDQPGL